MYRRCNNKFFQVSYWLVSVVFFGLFGQVLEVFLSSVSPVPVAGIYRGQELELCVQVLCVGLFNISAVESGFFFFQEI